MKKILIAVDKSTVSKNIIAAYLQRVQPADTVILLTVVRLEGGSLMIDMLGEAELSTLRESIKGTRHKEALDREAAKVLAFYEKKLRKVGRGRVRTLVREGRPAEEILKVADEEGVDMILIGNDGKKGIDRLIAGNTAREVRQEAKVPVMTARKTVMCEEPYSWGDAYAAFSALTIVVFGLLLVGLIM